MTFRKIKLLLATGLLLLNLFLPISSQSTEISSDSTPQSQEVEDRLLIVEAGNDLLNTSVLTSSPNDYEVFIKYDSQGRFVFKSVNWPDTKSPEVSRDNLPNKTKVIIMSKKEDGLDPSEIDTYVVFLQSFLDDEAKYTGHKAYIRTIDGQKTVEWDFLTIQPKISFSFYTALTPSEEFISLSSTTGKQTAQEGRFLTFLKPVKNVVDAIIPCALHIFPPPRCKTGSGRWTAPPPPASPQNHPYPPPTPPPSETSTPPEVSTTKKPCGHKHWKSDRDDSDSSEEHSRMRRSIVKNEEPLQNNLNIEKKSDASEEKIAGSIELDEPITLEPNDKTTESSDDSETETTPQPFDTLTLAPTLAKEVPFKEIEELAGNINSFESSEYSIFSTSIRFSCPPESGAILHKQKCYCPPGTKKINKKCVSEDFYGSRIKRSDNSSKEASDDSILDENTESSSENEPSLLQPLGSFYLDVGKVYFNKEFAVKAVKDAPSPDSIKMLFNAYAINNSSLEHPIFESENLPFTGAMDCIFTEDKEFKNLKEVTLEQFADFILSTLRAECRQEIRNATVDLFAKNLVKLSKDKESRLVIMEPNSTTLADAPILNPNQWDDLISAIYLAKYSEAFEERKKAQKSNNVSPDGVNISSTVNTLSLFVEKVLQLLKDDKFQRHSVKVTTALVQTVSVYRDKNEKEFFILETSCKDCKQEQIIHEENSKQLSMLVDYIVNGTLAVIQDSLSFKDFYVNNKKP